MQIEGNVAAHQACIQHSFQIATCLSADHLGTKIWQKIMWNSMALLLKDYIIASGNFSLRLDTGNLPLPFRPLTAIRLACKGAF